ncbi:hypothetical protein C7M61_005226 [Candidozyma pseudohaemuli]|uniref:G-patch domain-containing protein n=1 Tax=Candidozyma pseudohaemuli TaxID=418784 RepID=A0A2P7YCR8_9ASCO|nr:hypothetical protein C7M61_005226 [[Candida] pseudohaemulonii]PSK33760.1 hypothetical protein C7M61_005226 [[Candida] pseudohaemulonii]
MKNVFGSSDDDDESDHDIPKRPVKKLKLKSTPKMEQTEPVEDYMSFTVEEDDVKPPSSKAQTQDTSLFETKSVGLAMMQKMGFKVGDSLGGSDTGIKEPIQAVQKKNRLGIGATSIIRKSEAEEKQDVDQLVSQRKQQLHQQNAANTVLKLQRFCFTASGDDELVFNKEDAAKVNILWRSVARKSISDLPRRRVLIDQETSQPDEEPDEELTSFEAKQPVEQLAQLIDFSRKNFLYCIYCLIQFSDSEDMAANCPGPDEEAHSL